MKDTVEERAIAAGKQDTLIGETERKMVERYKKALIDHEASAKEVESYFMPLVQAALKRGDETEATSLRDRCPDHVVKWFIMDQIRVARGDYDKPGGYDKNGKRNATY